MAKTLGARGPKQAGLASFFGFLSSSCSFAALAASRSIFAKGAHPVNAIAFLIASTNLVIELGIVLWVLVGWRFTSANFVLGIVMIVYANLLTRIWFPSKLTEAARAHAKESQKCEGMDVDQFMRGSWRDKLFSRKGWKRIADAFFLEWRMVWKEILIGFTNRGLYIRPGATECVERHLPARRRR